MKPEPDRIEAHPELNVFTAPWEAGWDFGANTAVVAVAGVVHQGDIPIIARTANKEVALYLVQAHEFCRQIIAATDAELPDMIAQLREQATP